MRFASERGRRVRNWLVAVVCTTIVLGIAVGAYRQIRWKRFGIVERGRLYRSGALTSSQLGSAIDKLRLKTVVCLAPELAERDRQACAERGVRCIVLAMPEDGLGSAEDFLRFLDLARDETAWPILVHCQAGVARTGAAVALFRMVEHGWTFDAAVDELRSFERRGRCEPELQDHIRRLYASWASAHVATRAAAGGAR